MRSTYPLASQTRQPRPKLAGGGAFDHVEKLVLHTTETAGWPGYPTFAPHLTYDPWKRQWNQHYSLEKSATTLVDGASTSVRENRDFAIQVEIVAYSDQKMAAKYGHNINDISDEAVRDLADFAAWLHSTAGLELNLVEGWLPYPQSYGNTKNRMSGSEYDAFRGILGHEHVSTNVHGDPGAPPWLDTMLRYAKQAAGQTTPAEQPDEKEHFMSKDIPYTKTPVQPFKLGRNELELNAEHGKTVVIGPNEGVDARATAVVLTADGKRAEKGTYLAYFTIVSYKEGTTTVPAHNREGTEGDQVAFAGSITALADKRSPRLRLVVEALVEGLSGYAEVTGWRQDK